MIIILVSQRSLPISAHCFTIKKCEEMAVDTASEGYNDKL